MAGSSATIIGSPTPCSTTRLILGYWSTMEVNSSQLISAGGSSSSKVRGQVSQSRLQRLVVSRYRHTGSAVATGARSAPTLSK